MRVDVHVPLEFLIARMTRLPLPSMKTFGVAALQGAELDPAAQYTSNSALPQPPPPTSYVQFVGAGKDPVGPLNSSLHACVHCACAGNAIAAKRNEASSTHRAPLEICFLYCVFLVALRLLYMICDSSIGYETRPTLSAFRENVRKPAERLGSRFVRCIGRLPRQSRRNTRKIHQL